MKCPQCNHEVPEGMAFCGNCGKSMAVKPSEEKRPRSKRGRRSWLWVLIAVPLIALVVLAVIFVPRWLGQPSQPEMIAAQPTSTPPTMQVASTTAPTQPPEPLPVPEEVWLTVSGVEVQQQEAPIRIDDGYMHGATHQDDFMRFASAGDPEWAGFEALGFNEGEAVMIRFRFSDDANFVIDFRTEAWDTPDTFQWGFVQERSWSMESI